MSERQYFQGIIRTPFSSRRASSLSVLFVRVTWSRDLRAGGRSKSERRLGRRKVLHDDSLRSTARKSRLQVTRAYNSLVTK